MTYTNMFNEVNDSIELKKLKEEIEKHKKTIDTFETDVGIKDWHIKTLKDEIKELKEALENTE